MGKRRSMSRGIADVIAQPLEHSRALQWVAESVRPHILGLLLGRGRREMFWHILRGTWLGHPLHPVLTDIPVGAWTLAAIFDALTPDGESPYANGARRRGGLEHDSRWRGARRRRACVVQSGRDRNVCNVARPTPHGSTLRKTACLRCVRIARRRRNARRPHGVFAKRRCEERTSARTRSARSQRRELTPLPHRPTEIGERANGTAWVR